MPNPDSSESFFSSMKQTLRSWMTADRIRIVGSQGRSLQIQTGDRLVIGDCCWKVNKRTATKDSNDAQRLLITYELGSDETENNSSPPCILEVAIYNDGTAVHQNILRQGTLETQISDEDITILR